MKAFRIRAVQSAGVVHFNHSNSFSKQVMFSSALVSCLFVGLCKNYTIDFNEIPWRGGVDQD